MVFCNKYKQEISALQNKVQQLTDEALNIKSECEKQLTALRNEAETAKRQARISEDQHGACRTALFGILNAVGDNNDVVNAQAASYINQIRGVDELPFMDITFIVEYDEYGPARTLNRLISHIETRIRDFPGGIFVGPSAKVSNKRRECVVYVRTKYRGSFSDACAQFHWFLESSRATRGTIPEEIDPDRRNVTFRRRRGGL